MPTNEKSYQREYMARHNTAMECAVCHGHYRKYFKNHHEKSKKHQHMVENTATVNESRIMLANIFKAQKDRIDFLEQELKRTTESYAK